MSEDTNLDPKHYELMSDAKPYKCYIKRILGQLWITILDPYDESKITGLILKGNPKAANHDTCIVKLWTPKQDKFFKELNKRHFDAGRLLEIPVDDVVKSEQVVERPYTDYNDDELLELLSLRYSKLVEVVNKIDQQAVLGALISLAEEHDKSKRTITLLQSKLAQLQEKDYTPNTTIEK